MNSSKHRWTVEQVEHMRKLRHEDRYSLKAIGLEYDISRERVRQIIGNTGHIQLANIIGIQNLIRRKAAQGLPVDEIARQVDMHPKSVERIIRNHRRD